MKFWNKQKEVRLRCWTRVQLPQPEPKDHEYTWPDYWEWAWNNQFNTCRHALQRHALGGKFYMRVNDVDRSVWFQRASDATWFILNNYWLPDTRGH